MQGFKRYVNLTYVTSLFFCCFYFRGCLCGTSIEQNQCGFVGESVLLTCSVQPGEFLQAIVWSNGILSGDISSCIPISCGSTGNVRYVVDKNSTGISMAITSLTRADDETAWKCTLQGDPTSSHQLIVRDYPTTCTLSKNTDGSYKCETDCGYTASDLTIDWFLNTTSGVVDLTDQPLTTATTGCSIGGKASATFSASAFSEAGNLSCKCGMQSACPEKALIVSNSEAVTASKDSSNTSQNQARIGLAVTGIVITLICLPIVWIVYVKELQEVKNLQIAASISTGIGVIGIILCIVGLVLSESGLIPAIIGFVLSLFVLIFTIVIVTKGVRKNIDGNAGHHGTETNTDKSGNENVTDDQKGQAKGEEGQQQGEKDSEHIKATPDEMKGVSDKKPEAV